MIITHDKNKITHPYFNDHTNRWLPGLTNEQHHQLPAISSSAVKYFHKKSPWAFYQKFVLRQSVETETKDAFRMGTLIHLAILETEVFDKTVFICDETLNSIKYKQFRDDIFRNFYTPSSDTDKNELLLDQPKIRDAAEAEIVSEQIQEIQEVKEELEKKASKVVKKKSTKGAAKIENDDEIALSKNGGFIIGNNEIFIIKSREMDMLKRIQDNVKNHTRLSLMLPNSTHIEQSGIAQCPKTGLFLSCRGDARSDLGFFIDPKSIMDLSRHSMEYAQANFGYYLQHVHYLYVANLIEHDKYENFYFLYVSKEFPHEVCFSHLDEESIAQATKLYFEILNRIAECEYNQSWPTLDNSNGLMLTVPRWAFY